MSRLSPNSDLASAVWLAAWRAAWRGVTRLQDHVPEELILLFAVCRLWWLLDLAL